MPSWNELRAIFRELQPSDKDGLSAFCDEGQWDLHDAPSATVLRRFKSAADHAVRKWAKGGSWPEFLNLLRAEEHNFRLHKYANEADLEGGYIPRVCEAAADYCEKQLHYDDTSAAIQRFEEFRHARIMRAFPPAPDIKATIEQPPEPAPSDPPRTETIASQLNRLRKESNLTAEDIAKELDVTPRSVFRHLSGEVIPHGRHLTGYEKTFSRVLERKVVIRKTS